MDSVELVLQPENEQALLDKLATRDEPSGTFRSGMAYLTKRGLDTLQDMVPESINDDTTKEWVVSISDGITSPDALRTLNTQTNSEVRIMAGEEAIENFRFRTTPSFHPKLLWFNHNENHDIFLGSHNLTRDALKVNWEAGVYLQGLSNSNDPEKISQIGEYWNEIWTTADPCTTEFIDRYEQERTEFLDKQSPQFIQEVGDPNTPIHEAKYLWAKIGAVSGGSQNQVDIPFYCSRFFSREARTFEVGDKIKVILWYRGQPSDNRSIQGNPKGMTRVNLPTDVKYISDLEDYYVVFEKLDGQEFKVVLVPDEEEESGILGFLRRRSQELGTVGEATSGRIYGWL
jgi:HKD family nuclease